MTFAAFNGLGLALLVPCCQSLTADLFPAESRGRAFGVMQLTGALGGMLGGVYATNMGGHRPYGMDGWRFAFHTVAVVSIIMGILALLYAVDPRASRGVYSLLPSSDPSVVLGGNRAGSQSNGKHSDVARTLSSGGAYESGGTTAIHSGSGDLGYNSGAVSYYQNQHNIHMGKSPGKRWCCAGVMPCYVCRAVDQVLLFALVLFCVLCGALVVGVVLARIVTSAHNVLQLTYK